MINPPSLQMLQTNQVTRRMINRLDAIFQTMQQMNRFNNIPGLAGGRDSPWRQWCRLAQEQLNAAMITGAGAAIDGTYNNIQGMTNQQIPAGVKGLVSAIASQIQKMNDQYQQNNPPAVPDNPDDDEGDGGVEDGGNGGGGEGDGGNGGEGDAGGYLPPGADYSERCLAARTGHGHEGEPCRVRLGEDGVCQYHG